MTRAEMQARLATAEAKAGFLDAEADVIVAEGLAWKARAESAEAEVARLERLAPWRVVQHHRACAKEHPLTLPEDAECTCGLDAALTALKDTA